MCTVSTSRIVRAPLGGVPSACKQYIYNSLMIRTTRIDLEVLGLPVAWEDVYAMHTTSYHETRCARLVPGNQALLEAKRMSCQCHYSLNDKVSRCAHRKPYLGHSINIQVMTKSSR
jgi:hypothetical protein